MNKNEKIEEILNARQASLSSEQKNVLWNRIQAEVLTPKPVPSPFLFNFKTKKTMAPIALAVLLMLSVGGTAAASNDARPGDLLFPVDRALEKVHLAIINNDEDKARLHLSFAEERLAEIRSLLEEENNDDSVAATSTATSTLNFEAEANVFTDITIVKVELNGQKTTFETTADTNEAIITEIATRFDLDEVIVAAGLDFEVEDRASRIQDLSTRKFSDDTNHRIDAAIDLLAQLLGDENINGDDRAKVLTDLLSEFESDDSSNNHKDKIEFKEKEDDIRMKIKEDGDRIEIREKDGQTTIKFKAAHDEDGDDKKVLENNKATSTLNFEAEANVFTDITIVKVEIDNHKITFETTADTRAEVVAEIVKRFSLSVTAAEVEAALDFEVEDRAYKVETINNDEKEREYEDDDEDEYKYEERQREDDDREDEEDDDHDFQSEDRVKIEVRVEGLKAEVSMEYNGKKSEFETLYTTKAALIAELALKSGLTEATISDALDLEIR